MVEKEIEAYCPYENNNLNETCKSCKGNKVKFKYEFTQPGNPKKNVPDFHSYRCPLTTSFKKEDIETYNKNRKDD